MRRLTCAAGVEIVIRIIPVNVIPVGQDRIAKSRYVSLSACTAVFARLPMYAIVRARVTQVTVAKYLFVNPLAAGTMELAHHPIPAPVIPTTQAIIVKLRSAMVYSLMIQLRVDLMELA